MIPMGLSDIAIVYVPDDNGDYTVVHRAELRCRLAVRPSPAVSAERADLTENRRLLWNDDYMMPATAQVVVNGRRWNVKAGTVDRVQNLVGGLEYWRADVTEAES